VAESHPGCQIARRKTRPEADQLFNSSEKRLARLLLLLRILAGRKTEPMIAKISQETLAEMIGTNPIPCEFFMNKFRKLGFIPYNGHIEVHSSLLISFCTRAAHRALSVLILLMQRNSRPV